MSRLVYIDLGANRGDTAADFMRATSECFDVFLVEPNPRLAADLRHRFRHAYNVTVHEMAAWTEVDEVNFYPGVHSDESGTIMRGKIPTVPKWEVDYSACKSVPATDFDGWLRSVVGASDHVIMKMDIEGAEYPVLAKMLESGSIDLVDEARIEWHFDRYPDVIDPIGHMLIRSEVADRTKLVDWH